MASIRIHRRSVRGTTSGVILFIHNAICLFLKSRDWEFANQSSAKFPHPGGYVVSKFEGLLSSCGELVNL